MAKRKTTKKKTVKKQAPKMNPKLILAGVLLVVAGILGFGMMEEDCTIKGNVTNYGKTYHMVGQPTYRMTDVNPANGDEWFCSEADAKAAGFKKALR